MVLQGTVRGARGYVFYAYHAIYLYSEKADPGKTQMQWANVVPVIRLLHELTPFILSKEKAPEVEVRQIAGPAVEAKALTHDGKTCMVIAAVGPGRASAELFVRGEDRLTSKYGKTKNLGGGKYLFEGTDVSSDVLMP